MNTKVATFHEIRFFAGNDFSKRVGYKGRLVSPERGRKIVRRLRKAGVNAFAAKFKIKVKGA